MIKYSPAGRVDRDQDGRVGGHRNHLPPQTHQKCIYMWNHSH